MTYEPKLDHALVIGGSLGGMGAARALSRHYKRVTIVDRDALPEREPRPRRGVPQSMQVHGVQIRGRAELERAFPGFMQSLLDQGAVDFDLSADVARFTPWGWAPRFDSGIPMMMCTRPLLETTVRRLFRQQADNVTWLEGARVTGLTWRQDGDARQVTGVTTDAPGRATIAADLVVDASGRGTKVARWLGAMGLPAPALTVVDSHSNYAARHFRAPPEARAWPWKALIVDAVTPDVPCAASLFTVEEGKWLVTAMGMDGHYAPSEPEAWTQFLRDLRAPAIAQAVARAEPVSDVIQSRSMTSYMRAMHRYRPTVRGYMLFGDAIGAFNPTYGQGITLHAIATHTLARTLERFGHLGPDAVQSFYRAHQRTLREGWQFSAHFDLRWPSCEGRRPPLIGLMHRLGELTLKVSMQDPVLFKKLAPLSDFGANRLVLAQPAVVARVWLQLARLTFLTPRLPGPEAFSPCAPEALGAGPAGP